MCKGLAICINKDGKILCDGSSKHGELKRDVSNPEGWLDFECVLPCWYEPVLDKNDYVMEIWKKNGLLTTHNEPRKKLYNAAVKWLQDNKTQVLEWFLFKPNLQAYATVRGDQDLYGQTIEGHQYHDDQTVRGDQYHRNQTIKGNQYHGYQTIEGHQNHHRQTIEGEIYIRYLEQGDKELQKALDEFYETEQDKHTWGTFYTWVITKENKRRQQKQR